MYFLYIASSSPCPSCPTYIVTYIPHSQKLPVVPPLNLEPTRIILLSPFVYRPKVAACMRCREISFPGGKLRCSFIHGAWDVVDNRDVGMAHQGLDSQQRVSSCNSLLLHIDGGRLCAKNCTAITYLSDLINAVIFIKCQILFLFMIMNRLVGTY